MTRITKVTITVETDEGEVITVKEKHPGPGGDNPRYLVRQVDSGVQAAHGRVEDAIMGMYRDQIPRLRTEA